MMPPPSQADHPQPPSQALSTSRSLAACSCTSTTPATPHTLPPWPPQELEEQLEQRGQRAPGPAASRAELLQQLGSASSWTKLAGLVQLAQQQALLDPELTSAALTSLSTSYKDKLAGLNASNRWATGQGQASSAVMVVSLCCCCSQAVGDAIAGCQRKS